jgi:N,N'-diacetyllegionaminate synthase
LKYENSMSIGNKTIDSRNGFVIAEVGSNHARSLELAFSYLEAAAECGVDAVKFQFFDASDIVASNHEAYSEVESYVTPIEWIPKLKKYCDELNLVFFGSAFNLNAFEALESSQTALHKIASSELLNSELLLAAGRSMKPVLVSLGMSEWFEVEMALKVLESTENKGIIPMHCISKYPLDTSLANLKTISKLISRYGNFVGFSDHTENVEIGGWAAVLGARVFEKHITLNRNKKGADHWYALEPGLFKKYTHNIRESLTSLGDGEKYYLEDEKKGRRRKSIYTMRSIEIGEKLHLDNISEQGPRDGIPSTLIGMLTNLKSNKKLKENQKIKWEDF